MSGFTDRDGPAVTKIGRISIRGIKKGLVEAIDIEDFELSDEAVPIRTVLKSTRIRGLWPEHHAVAGVVAEDFRVTGNDFTVGIAAAVYRATAALASRRSVYFPEADLTLSDVTILPGRAPGPDVAALFAGLGREGLRLRFDGRATMAPEGADFVTRSSMTLSAQTGDTITFDGRALLIGENPGSGWQWAIDVLRRGLENIGGANAKRMEESQKLIHGEITVKAGRLIDRMIEAAARDSGIGPTAMRKRIAERAVKVLRVLPGGGAAFRKAVTRFFLRSGTLSLVFRPHQPVPLTSLLTVNDKNLAAVYEKLNISISHTGP